MVDMVAHKFDQGSVFGNYLPHDPYSKMTGCNYENLDFKMAGPTKHTSGDSGLNDFAAENLALSSI